MQRRRENVKDGKLEVKLTMDKKEEDMDLGIPKGSHSRKSSVSSTGDVFDNDFSDEEDEQEDDDPSSRNVDVETETDFSQDREDGNKEGETMVEDGGSTVQGDHIGMKDDISENGEKDGKENNKSSFEKRDNKVDLTDMTHTDNEIEPDAVENQEEDDELEILICEDHEIDAKLKEEAQKEMDLGIELAISDDTDSLYSQDFEDMFDWDMEEYDIYGMNGGKAWDDAFATDKHNSYVTERVLKALRAKCNVYPRIFHTRSNPDKEYTDYGTSKSRISELTMHNPIAVIAKIAKHYKMDVIELLKKSEHLLQFSFPCMQCYESVGYGMDAIHGSQSVMQKSSDGKCASCGGAVTTASSFGQMIVKMRNKLKAKKLFVHDVYPDGNCLFGAVIDQLRIRGNFRFTINSLRRAAVDHLRNNPCSDDGTPYEMFLTNETWEAYLQRMSKDGQWGDHIILSAIATLLKYRLVIYGGLSGEGETIIEPRECKEPTKGEDKLKEENENEKEEDKKMEEEQDEKEQVEEAAELDYQTMFMGHLGESHYISLRPEKWKEKLQECILSKAPSSDTSEQNLEELSEKLLPFQCNSFFKSLFLLEYITSRSGDAVDVLAPGREETADFVFEMVGMLISKLEPAVCKIESLMPDVDIYFPESSEKISEKIPKKSCPTMILFCSPKDTRVVFNQKNAHRLDLICQPKDSAQHGEMRLVPNTKKKWTKCLSETGCLKTFLVKKGVPFDTFRVLEDFTDIDVYPVIAYRCRWPDDAAEWILRQQQAGWLDESVVQEIVVGGCHVVPALSDKDMKGLLSDFRSSEHDDEGCDTWVISFAAAEKKLFSLMSVPQKKCFLFFQMYLSSVAKDVPLAEAIVRSIFLYAVENTEAIVWDQKPANCILKLMQNLAQGLEKGVIPHYFVPSRNLISSMPKPVARDNYKKIQAYCNQPFLSLYFFLDQYNITTSEVGPFLDDMLGNMSQIDVTQPDSYYYQVVLPSLASILSSCATVKDFPNAAFLVKHMKEEIHSLTGVIVPEATIIINSMMGLFFGLSWCLALYMDLVDGTMITKEVHESRSTVSISDVFGPECTEELPDTLVDSWFLIENGDLYFPAVVEGILHRLGKDRAIIKCLQYYLDTLKDSTGDHLYFRTCDRTNSHNPQLLCDLYIKLFNAYARQNCVSGFKDMVPTLEKVVKTLGTKSSYDNLQTIFKQLGDNERAKDWSHYNTSMPASASSFSSVLQALKSIVGQNGTSFYDD